MNRDRHPNTDAVLAVLDEHADLDWARGYAVHVEKWATPTTPPTSMTGTVSRDQWQHIISYVLNAHDAWLQRPLWHNETVDHAEGQNEPGDDRVTRDGFVYGNSGGVLRITRGDLTLEIPL